MADSVEEQSLSFHQSSSPSVESTGRRKFRDDVREGRSSISQSLRAASGGTSIEPPHSSFTSPESNSQRTASNLANRSPRSAQDPNITLSQVSPSLSAWGTPAPSSIAGSTRSRLSESRDPPDSTPGIFVPEQSQSWSAEESGSGNGTSARYTTDLEEGEINERSTESEAQGPDMDIPRPTGVPLRIGQKPPNKRPWRVIEEGPQPSEQCECPVSEHCNHVPGDRLDCRTYAPIPKRPRKYPKFDSFRKINLERIDSHQLSDILAFNQYEQKIRDGPLHEWAEAQIAIRRWIEKMRFFKMDQLLCDQSFIIHKLRVLIIFGKRNPSRVPVDIVEDLTYFRRKWRAHIWDPDPLRGIVLRLNRRISPEETTSFSRRLLPGYESRKSADYFGHGSLVNGQCWPNQICMVRDGAHGCMEGGIYGDKEGGARSVVLSNPSQRDDYADQDQGKWVRFVGTSKNDRMTEDGQFVDRDDWHGNLRQATRSTEAMFASISSGDPVRLFRSFRLPEINIWRPQDGFRYDGLYIVKRAQRLDEDRAVYRFTLRRMDHQNPIRLDRPSRREMEEFARLRLQQKKARGGGF